jgi:integrase/recombinase XerD
MCVDTRSNLQSNRHDLTHGPIPHPDDYRSGLRPTTSTLRRNTASWTQDVVTRLIVCEHCCDRRRTVGRRDYAVLLLLLLLSRLGPRAGEVAAITLDDIDWRGGELLIHNGKGRRDQRLPVPADVGAAIVSYLRRRPQIKDRALFLRVIAPAGGIGRRGVSAIVGTACKRVGVPVVGSHALRHTAASEMFKAGASLQEIGEVLGHLQPRTTARYAKVDRETLRALARPWPQGGAA